jgi:flavodoxin
MAVKALLVLYSYHNHNTEKIAVAMAEVLGAAIRTPAQVTPEELLAYDLVGFGSGIYSAKHHQTLLDLADKLPPAGGKRAFIFSTCGVPAFGFSDDFMKKNHARLREELQARGYVIAGEFGCVGWNTNSFLRLFGGLNKGRPDGGDLERAKEFALRLKLEH